MTAIDEVKHNLKALRQEPFVKVNEILFSPDAYNRVCLRLAQRGFSGGPRQFFDCDVRVTPDLMGFRYQIDWTEEMR